MAYTCTSHRELVDVKAGLTVTDECSRSIETRHESVTAVVCSRRTLVNIFSNTSSACNTRSNFF